MNINNQLPNRFHNFFHLQLFNVRYKFAHLQLFGVNILFSEEENGCLSTRILSFGF